MIGYTWSLSQCVDPVTRVIDWGAVGPMLDAIEEGGTHDVPPATLAILMDAFTVATRSDCFQSGESNAYLTSDSMRDWRGELIICVGRIALRWKSPAIRNVMYDAHPLPVGERHWPEFQKRDAIGFLRRLAECVRKGEYTIPEEDE